MRRSVGSISWAPLPASTRPLRKRSLRRASRVPARPRAGCAMRSKAANNVNDAPRGCRFPCPDPGRARAPRRLNLRAARGARRQAASPLRRSRPACAHGARNEVADRPSRPRARRCRLVTMEIVKPGGLPPRKVSVHSAEALSAGTRRQRLIETAEHDVRQKAADDVPAGDRLRALGIQDAACGADISNADSVPALLGTSGATARASA